MEERRLRLAKVKYDYEKSLTEFDAKIMEQVNKVLYENVRIIINFYCFVLGIPSSS